jgi:hypothetical protein
MNRLLLSEENCIQGIILLVACIPVQPPFYPYQPTPLLLEWTTVDPQTCRSFQHTHSLHVHSDQLEPHPIDKLEKFHPQEAFGECISNLLAHRHVLRLDFPILNLLPDEVLPDIYVLCLVVECGVPGECNCGLAVDEEFCE